MIDENKISCSMVIPVFNEEEVLLELYKRLTTVMEKLNEKYEIIFVDDGSKDKSFEILKKLCQQDKRLKIIRFSRNFGHHIAVTAGLDYAGGNTIVLMDADLQDPPEEIPKLYKKFKEGYDIVYAIRKTRNDSFFKKLFSKLFYKIFKLVSKVEIPPNIGIFRIISKQVVNNLKKCREKSRFVIALIGWTGFSSIGVETNRDERYAGKSKYNFLKSTKLAIDSIVSFSSFPLHLISILGFLVAAFSFVIGIYMSIKKIFFGMPVSGYASLIISLYFLGGIQLIIIGIIGEYIGRIYSETQNRPLYIIKEEIGFNENK